MKYKQILLLGILLSAAIFSYAFQTNTGGISGVAKDDAGNPIPHATVVLQPSGRNTVANQQGHFLFKKLAPGKYTLTCAVVGYADASAVVEVSEGSTATAHFSLKATTDSIDEVTVYGRSATQQVNQQAYNVTAIDAKKLYNTTLDLAHSLDRVSGVRIRESGGVGSSMSFSLNGFSGRQVKMFLDGVPMDNFGSSFQLNNIPINLAERVEVYKAWCLYGWAQMHWAVR